MAESKYKPRLLSYVFDPFELTGIKIKSKEKRERALEQVADYVLTETLSKVADGQSPVKGYGSFDKLSPGYRLVKKAEAGNTKNNLELSGDMLDALTSEVKSGKVALEIEGEQAEKADGHNQLTGRASNLPLRRFIPSADEVFKKEITDGIKRIVKSYAEEDDEA